VRGPGAGPPLRRAERHRGRETEHASAGAPSGSRWSSPWSSSQG